jgi:hypothetical protein
VVPSSEAFTPVPAFGFSFVRNGGQRLAQAPKHVLFGPVSFSNRYRLRPRESTRILPRLVVLTLTVAPPEALGCFVVVVDGLALALPEPPPQPAIATAIIGTASAGARVMLRRRVMPPRSSSNLNAG